MGGDRTQEGELDSRDLDIRSLFDKLQHDVPIRFVEPIAGTVHWPQQVVRGCFQYRAVSDNQQRLKEFRKEVLLWYRAIKRRSQRSSLTRHIFNRRLGALLSAVQIAHPYPDRRFNAKYCDPR